MKSRNVLLSVLLLWTASLFSCNLPSNTPTQAPSGDIEPTFTLIPSATPVANSASACGPSVKTTTLANVRNGPGQIYAVIGSLPLGGTAPVAGKSADGAWWYIEFAAGEAGHAWIAGIVTTASCIPDSLAVIAAPVAPVLQANPPSNPAVVDEPEESNDDDLSEAPPPATPTSPFIIFLLPVGDISIQGIEYDPGNEIFFRIKLSPAGSLTGNFEYKVWKDDTLLATRTGALPTNSYGQEIYGTGVNGNDLFPGEVLRIRVDTANTYYETNESNNEYNLTAGG